MTLVAIAQQSFAELRTAGLADIDPQIADLLGREADRQRGQIELIASENFTWPAIFEAVGSVPTNKYAEGYPGKRYYGGCEVVDEVEELARSRAKELFGAEHANVQPHAGAQANMAVYFAALAPGDRVLGLSLDHGGHLTHGLKVNFSGKLYDFHHYGVSRETMQVDYDEVLARAKEVRPKLIVCGGSAYPRTVEADRFREIADEVGALLMCDMAHFAGLVAAGLHPNPVPHCDFVTSTSHKTLAGPRAGFVLCREEHASKLDRANFPGMQGGPLMHAVAAKAVCFAIAMTEAFREYQRQVRANADALAETLMQRGHDVLTGGTDTHLVQLDLRRTEWTGLAAQERLEECKLTANRNTVPFDERPPMVASGVRLGTPAATMRGFDEDDFREVAAIICDALHDDADVDALRDRALALCERRPLYPGFRGYTAFSA
jgi:glycine hydroxymethyltransferase